ncbi:MAG: rod-binding protein [Desulfobacteraceae bacterium]|nr:rod-binding protein [Desulfobacteraceae bacterium]
MEITIGANGNVPGSGVSMANPATGKTAPRPSDKDAVAARRVAREFESLFVGMMIKSMRETVGKDKLINGGHGEEVYRSLLDQEYARSLTEHGGVGLAAIVERQLVKPAPDGAMNQDIQSHDTTNQSAKTEVTYENR